MRSITLLAPAMVSQATPKTPISRGSNFQLDERFGQHHRQAIIGNHAMD
jgi:hypothetical protein